MNMLFHSQAALRHSSYSWPANGGLVRYDGKPASVMQLDVHASFRALLHDADFPCVGAKSVVNQDSYRFGLYPRLGSPESSAGLALDLLQFNREQNSLPGEFHSYVASFLEPKVRSGAAFERLL